MLVVPAALVLAALALAGAQAGSIDDAFILAIYARNLAQGGEFAYRLGQPALDGFTSLGDLLLKSGALLLAPGDALRTMWVTTTVTYLLAVLMGVTAALCLAGGRAPRVGALAALAVTLTPGLAEGSAYLLGTPLYLALLALAAILFCECWQGAGRATEPALGALALALVIARPEGAPVAMTLLALRAARAPRPNRSWLALVLFLVGLAAYLGWRTAVFGYWAPNSYYAKTSATRWNEVRDGLSYLWAFVTGEFVLPASRLGRGLGAGVGAALLGWVFLAPLVVRRSSFSQAKDWRQATALWAAATAAMLTVVWSGGDCYRGARFLAPMSLLALLSAAVVASGARGPARVAALALLAGVLCLRTAEVLPGAGDKFAAMSQGGLSERDFVCERELAERLADALPEGRMAQRHLQSAAYFAPALELLDLTGINHREIAHRPETGPVRFGRNALDVALAEDVELIHLHHLPLLGAPAAEHRLNELLARPDLGLLLLGDPLPTGELAAELARRYRTASLEVCGPGRWFNCLVRADLAPALRRAGFLVAD